MANKQTPEYHQGHSHYIGGNRTLDSAQCPYSGTLRFSADWWAGWYAAHNDFKSMVDLATELMATEGYDYAKTVQELKETLNIGLLDAFALMQAAGHPQPGKD